MTFYETPQKICLNIIISMNYPIARINYSPCVRYNDIRIIFPDAVYRLAHDLYLTLHNAFRIISFWNRSNLFGKSIKQLSTSAIESRISCRYVITSSYAINHHFCPVDIGNKILVAQSLFLNKINLTSEEVFQSITKTEIIVYVVKTIMIYWLEIYKKINIAFFIEPICQDRPKDRQ